MSTKRDASITMLCPWSSKDYGAPMECLRERCPYYDFDVKTVVLNASGGTESYTLQSCKRADNQEVELEIVANIFRELRRLLKGEV